MDVTKISEVHNINSAFISNISGPNWEITPHKGMQRPTDTEFETIIEDLGKALADAIIKKDYTRYKKVRSFAEERVLSQYISIVSPDRKTLVKEAMQFINSVSKKQKFKYCTDDFDGLSKYECRRYKAFITWAFLY